MSGGHKCGKSHGACSGQTGVGGGCHRPHPPILPPPSESGVHAACPNEKSTSLRVVNSGRCLLGVGWEKRERKCIINALDSFQMSARWAHAQPRDPPRSRDHPGHPDTHHPAKAGPQRLGCATAPPPKPAPLSATCPGHRGRDEQYSGNFISNPFTSHCDVTLKRLVR